MKDSKINMRSTAGDQNEILIAFRGLTAKGTANELHRKLLEGGLPVSPLVETGAGDDRLGAAEIMITLVVAPIVHAAAKALIITSLKYVQDYLIERVSKHEDTSEINLQLVIKSADQPQSRRYPFRLRDATSEVIKSFFDQIRQSITKL